MSEKTPTPAELELAEIARAMSIPDLVDAYTHAREQRLKADKVSAELKLQENVYKSDIMRRMQETKQYALASTTTVLKYNLGKTAIVSDWKKLYAYIKRTGSFELLQRRLTVSAVQERWADNKQVPGVASFPVEDITISSI